MKHKLESRLQEDTFAGRFFTSEPSRLLTGPQWRLNAWCAGNANPSMKVLGAGVLGRSLDHEGGTLMLGFVPIFIKILQRNRINRA